MFRDINTRITICNKCNEIPFIKIYVKESKAYIKTICSCGNHYYDTITFLYLFTDKFINNNKQAAKFKEKEILYKNNKKVSIFNRTFSLLKEPDYNISFHICYRHKTEIYIGYCNECHINFCSLCERTHIKHIKQIIYTKDILMTEEELKTIKKNFKEINESVSKYLPELETSLIENLKTEKEKIEIHNLASYCIFKNTALILVLKAIINTYEKFPNKNPNIITNLRDNTDFNKTKYKLDFDSIDNERFTSYLKNHIIICGNHFINTLYTKLQKHKKEMEEMIYKIPEYEDGKIDLEIKEVFKTNRSIYYGEINKKNGLAYGRGFLFLLGGSRYYGYFKNDFFKDGFGKNVNSSGNIYIGQFKDGLNDGYGTLTTHTGRIYSGEWKKDKLEGYCQIKWPDGQIYEGEFGEGTFNGIGILQCNNGDVYKGEMENGAINGIGTMDYTDGRFYQGEFKSCIRGDFGIMKWGESQQVFEGEWKDSKLKFGLYTWPSGHQYFGNFCNDEITGQGIYYNARTCRMDSGVFKDGRREEINYTEVIPQRRYLLYL